ncbi:hypothetical protein [Flectobacillus roseus]|uniref:hypothetical protein n=1 Tax=Flectobacillus roseus TaxID=502259 RepID=UPI0024B7EC18|nr:hypothetical protein [Flectobacillus roseus]MDI9868926.1 hypothetical protein [Flectobacillus roseus]
MSYNIFPNENSIYKSEFEPVKLIETLKENTLIGSLSSTAYMTNKAFIGIIENDNFKIISSSNRISMLCVFEGRLGSEGKQVTLVKKFHPAFRNLFVFWVGAMLSLFIFFPGKANQTSTILMFLALVFLLRYLLITFIYRKSEEEGIEKLITILKLTEIE